MFRNEAISNLFTSASHSQDAKNGFSVAGHVLKTTETLMAKNSKTLSINMTSGSILTTGS